MNCKSSCLIHRIDYCFGPSVSEFYFMYKEFSVVNLDGDQRLLSSMVTENTEYHSISFPCHSLVHRTCALDSKSIAPTTG